MNIPIKRHELNTFKIIAALVVIAVLISFIEFIELCRMTDWERRVVMNGGRRPPAKTVKAIEKFKASLIESGLITNIHTLYIYAGQNSVIAAQTPVIYEHTNKPR